MRGYGAITIRHRHWSSNCRERRNLNLVLSVTVSVQMASKRFVLPVRPDPCPGLPIEKGVKGDGVGRWVPEQKHTLLAKWLGGTRAARIKFPSRVLIDPFCGPGRIQVVGETMTRDGGTLVAWNESVACRTPFTQVLIGDKDPGRADACYQRLKQLNAPVSVFPGPAAETIHAMAASVPRGALALAYVDPYNLEFLSFDIIKALSALPKVDLLVHFSTMDLSRNVDFELDPNRARFDDAAPAWRQALAKTAKAQLPSAFFEYWTGLIKNLGFTFSQEMPLIRGEGNKPLYRLVCFSRHPLPNRIWDDVAKGPNRNLFDL